METGLKGKKALITGGASGIGLGIAHSLAEEGVHLAIASRRPDPMAIRQLREIHPHVYPVEVDIRTEDEVVRMLMETRQRLGGLDLYVNNAAAAFHEAVLKLTSQAFFDTVNTNLASALFACREAGRIFVQQGSGSILIVGSTSRLTPGYREVSYRITKTGLKVLMQNLAIELAPWKIRVNMITPGHYPTRLTAGISPQIETKLTQEIPLRRFGDPDHEVGPAAVLLLSELLSGYTTGADLIIDGGLALRPLAFYGDDQLRDFNTVV